MRTVIFWIADAPVYAWIAVGLILFAAAWLAWEWITAPSGVD